MYIVYTKEESSPPLIYKKEYQTEIEVRENIHKLNKKNKKNNIIAIYNGKNFFTSSFSLIEKENSDIREIKKGNVKVEKKKSFF